MVRRAAARRASWAMERVILMMKLSLCSIVLVECSCGAAQMRLVRRIRGCAVLRESSGWTEAWDSLIPEEESSTSVKVCAREFLFEFLLRESQFVRDILLILLKRSGGTVLSTFTSYTTLPLLTRKIVR